MGMPSENSSTAAMTDCATHLSGANRLLSHRATSSDTRCAANVLGGEPVPTSPEHALATPLRLRALPLAEAAAGRNDSHQINHASSRSIDLPTEATLSGHDRQESAPDHPLCRWVTVMWEPRM